MIISRIMVDKTKANVSDDSFWFFLTVIYLIIEYGRPMDTIPGLDLLRPGMIVTILLALSSILGGNIANAKSRQTLMIAFFIFLLVVHIPFARNNRYAYNQTYAMLLYMPFILSVIIYLNSFERLKRFFNIWILLMIYLSIKGISGKGIGGSNFLADENDFSLLMNMMLPFGYFLFRYERDFKIRMFYLSSSLLAVVSVVASSSRGGFVGLLTVLLMIWLFSPKKIRSLLLIGILSLAIYFSADQKYWDDMQTISETDQGTSKERLDSWNAAWDMFKDNLLGVGGSNFPVRFPEYQPESMQRGMWGRQAHSIWFTLLPELGIFGMLIYGLLLFYNLRDINWLRKFKKNSDNNIRYAYYLSLAFIASFAGYFASGTFLSVLYYPHYFYLTAMIVAIKNLVEQRKMMFKV
jgi:probable O-glycosylation ligase (exosortase A-associated)